MSRDRERQAIALVACPTDQSSAGGCRMTLDARLAAYQTETGQTRRQAIRTLLVAALDARDARRRGGRGKWAGTTLEQRRAMTAAARQAALDARRP